MMMFKTRKRNRLFRKGMRAILFSIFIFGIGWGINYVIHDADFFVKCAALVAVIFAFIFFPKEDL